MTRALKILILLLVLTFCTNFIQSGEENDCEEYLEFSLDIGKWKLAFKNSNTQASIVEFTLKDENVGNWSELVTVQKFPPLDSSVEQYYHEFIKNLETVSPGQVYSRVINKKEDTILFEWWISEKSPLAQHEWFKLIQAPSSTMILRYTTKKLEQVEKVRNRWEEILDSATYRQRGCEKIGNRADS